MALSKEQVALLEKLGLPTDFSADMTDEKYFKIDDTMSDEMMRHGINSTGDGLNDYGELCRSVIVSLPDD